jgi:outer membrane protein TolC
MRLRTFLIGTLLTAAAVAQTTSFPKPDYFRQTFQKARTSVELKDPVKLQDYVLNGKVELSLKHYLELVMSNNTDIQIQFLSVEIPKNNIQAAFGVWDPVTTTRFSTTRQTSLPTSAIDTSNVSAVLKSLNQPYSLAYSQTLDTGTQYQAQFSGAKTSSSNTRSSYVKQLTANLNFQVTQPLLRNRGRYVNRLPLMTAQSNLKVSEFSLRDRLLTLVNTAENAYWSVVSARETVRVQETARDTAKTYLDFMQQQLDLGALSPLDIYNPKAALAQAEVALSQAKFNLTAAEDVVRRQLSVDLNPEIRKLPIVLTEAIDPGSAESQTVDREDAVQKAMNNTPALKAALQKLDVDDLGIQTAKNGLLPNLMFTAGYSSNGLGGIYDPNRSSLLGGASIGAGVLPLVPGGIGDALGQMFGFGYPTYTAGLTLTLPIRSRTASANMANALVQKKTDALTLRSQQQTVRLQVLTAVTNLEGAKEQLKLAVIQRDFAKLNLDAENEKYRLGTETNQNVVFAQQAMAQADLGVVNAQINVRRSLLNLLTQTGELLDDRGIVVK